jgi:hypothetical protein
VLSSPVLCHSRCVVALGVLSHWTRCHTGHVVTLDTLSHWTRCHTGHVGHPGLDPGSMVQKRNKVNGSRIMSGMTERESPPDQVRCDRGEGRRAYVILPA